jgi:hypothetical protein
MSLMDAWKSVEQGNEPINQETVSDPIDGKRSLWKAGEDRFDESTKPLRGAVRTSDQVSRQPARRESGSVGKSRHRAEAIGRGRTNKIQTWDG